MAGAAGLKIEQQILRALAHGPQTKIDLRKALGWSVWGEHKALEGVLQRMRVAGLVEPHTKANGGMWRIREGLAVCEHCHGKGLLKAGGPE